MIAQINISENTKIEVDFSNPIPIAIPIKNGRENPNCYWADSVKFETIHVDGFIGSIKEGGSVNYQKLEITPHGNGTHTECYGHITDSGATINQQLNNFHFYAKLVSLQPTIIENGDSIIKLTDAMEKENWQDVSALIIRTVPNLKEKLYKQYSGTNPPYIALDFIRFMVVKGIKHLLIDLPSVDKEVDGGKLLAHNAFWGLPDSPRNGATITELIFVPNSINDGRYLLNLQTLALEMDATPSLPILYKADKLLLSSE